MEVAALANSGNAACRPFLRASANMIAPLKTVLSKIGIARTMPAGVPSSVSRGRDAMARMAAPDTQTLSPVCSFAYAVPTSSFLRFPAVEGSTIMTGSLPLYRIGEDRDFRAAGGACGSARVVRTFRDADAFLAASFRLAPGIVLIDLDALPDPISIVARLRRRGSIRALLIQTSARDLETGGMAMQAGVTDVLTKPYSSECLQSALAKAAAVTQLVGRGRPVQSVAQLSTREREVVAGLVRGLTNKQIGLELGISHRTVEIHRARLMRKLGAASRPALLDIAFPQRDLLPERPRKA